MERYLGLPAANYSNFRKSCGYVNGSVLDEAVYQHDGGGVAIEGFDDGPEGLLSCCIPDMQFDFIIADF